MKTSSSTAPLRKMTEPISQVNELITLAKQVRSAYHARTRWTVSIKSGDLFYAQAHSWFIANTDGTPPRSIEARSRYDHSGDERQTVLRLFYDESRERAVEIEGHVVLVSLAKNGTKSSDKSGETAAPIEDDGFRMPQPDVLYFHSRTREGQQAVIRLLTSFATAPSDQKPALHLLNSWGSWQRRDDLPERTLDSVVLAKGQIEGIRDDFAHFLDSEAAYNSRGIPWHRGYLFHGPPGTGKTSIARALAAHFKLDLWYAPLGDLNRDSNLLNLIAEVRPGSILLLEDIDVFHAATSREAVETNKGVTMAGLLNALDGVSTPHGLISIMTSNHADVIDTALIRPGRIDRVEKIDLLTREQATRMFEQFYGVPLTGTGQIAVFAGQSPAALTEVFKKHLDDPVAAVWEMSQMARTHSNV